MGTFLTRTHDPLSALARVATILSRKPKRTYTSPQYGKSHRRSRGWPLRRHRNRHRNCTFELTILLMLANVQNVERWNGLGLWSCCYCCHSTIHSCGCFASPPRLATPVSCLLSPVSFLHYLIPLPALFKKHVAFSIALCVLRVCARGGATWL